MAGSESEKESLLHSGPVLEVSDSGEQRVIWPVWPPWRYPGWEEIKTCVLLSTGPPPSHLRIPLRARGRSWSPPAANIRAPPSPAYFFMFVAYGSSQVRAKPCCCCCLAHGDMASPPHELLSPAVAAAAAAATASPMASPLHVLLRLFTASACSLPQNLASTLPIPPPASGNIAMAIVYGVFVFSSFWSATSLQPHVAAMLAATVDGCSQAVVFPQVPGVRRPRRCQRLRPGASPAPRPTLQSPPPPSSSPSASLKSGPRAERVHAVPPFIFDPFIEPLSGPPPRALSACTARTSLRTCSRGHGRSTRVPRLSAWRPRHSGWRKAC